MFLLTKCISVDLAFKVLVAEKNGGKECVPRHRDVFLYGEMREMVIF